jgi:hypothetical protein
MSRLASLFSRRVPLYIWLPIVLACVAVGFIASTLLVRPIASTPHIPRSEGPSQAPVTASPAEEPRRATGSQPSRVLGPPHETPSIVVSTDEVDLPTPAPGVGGRPSQLLDDVEKSTTPAPVSKGTPPRARVARADHSVARAHRPHRMAQQPAKAPSSSAAGLKNVPLIGPAFSLFQ